MHVGFWLLQSVQPETKESVRPSCKSGCAQTTRQAPRYKVLTMLLMSSGSGGLLERMTKCGPDIISVDGSVDLLHAITRCGKEFAYQVHSPVFPPLPPVCIANAHAFACGALQVT